MDKPNFERIEFSLQKSQPNLILYNLGERLWEHMQQNNKPGYDKMPAKNILIELLKAYQLEEFQNDMFCFAYYFIHMNDHMEYFSGIKKKELTERKELLNSLKLLFDSQTDKIKIDIKHKEQLVSSSIQAESLILTIKEALLSYFKKREVLTNLSYLEFDNYQNWGNQEWSMYLDWLLNNLDSYHFLIFGTNLKMKGRTEKHFYSKKIMKVLQVYLQEFTNLKAEEGKSVSRSQALFIYEFLNFIIPEEEELSWKEDNVRHILNKYQKEKTKKIEIQERKNIIEAKIKEINKNK